MLETQMGKLQMTYCAIVNKIDHVEGKSSINHRILYDVPNTKLLRPCASNHLLLNKYTMIPNQTFIPGILFFAEYVTTDSELRS